MSGGLESLSLILHDFKNGMLIPEDKTIIKFIGTINGLEKFKYNNIQLSFANKDRMIILFIQEEYVRHCLFVMSSSIQNGFICINAKTINGDNIDIKITNIKILDLSNFSCKIYIPKCSWGKKK